MLAKYRKIRSISPWYPASVYASNPNPNLLDGSLKIGFFLNPLMGPFVRPVPNTLRRRVEFRNTQLQNVSLKGNNCFVVNTQLKLNFLKVPLTLCVIAFTFTGLIHCIGNVMFYMRSRMIAVAFLIFIRSAHILPIDGHVRCFTIFSVCRALV